MTADPYTLLDSYFNGREVYLLITGKPEAWKRAQVAQGQSSRNVSPGRVSGKMYNPNASKQRALRKCIRDGLRAQGIGNDDEPLFQRGAPLEARLVFYLPRPKHHFKQEILDSGLPTRVGEVKAQFLDRTSLQYYCTKPPDIDNLAKFVMDTPLKGIVFHDDRLVVKGFFSKDFDIFGTCTEGHTEITIARKDLI